MALCWGRQQGSDDDITEDLMEPVPYPDGLKDEDIKIRASAIIALGKTGDRNAIKPLVEILENTSEVDWLRACAAIALGRVSGKEVIPSLVKALQDDSNVVFRAVVSALGDTRNALAIPPLKKILEDQSRQELLPLLLCAETVNRRGAQAQVRVQNIGGGGTCPGKLFHSDGHGKLLAPATTVLRGYTQAEQPHLRHLLKIVPGELLLPVQLVGHWRQLLIGEVPDRGLEHLVFFT